MWDEGLPSAEFGIQPSALHLRGDLMGLMFMIRKSRVLVCFASLLVAPVGCGIFNGNGNNPGGGAPSFATTVVIGDSLSAGFQNGSLLDTQQPNGWASLVATQGKFSLDRKSVV